MDATQIILLSLLWFAGMLGTLNLALVHSGGMKTREERVYVARTVLMAPLWPVVVVYHMAKAVTWAVKNCR